MRCFLLTIFVILLCWSILGEARNILNDVYSQFKDENIGKSNYQINFQDSDKLPR